MRILLSGLTATLLAAAIASPVISQTPEEQWHVVGMKGGAMGWETLNTDIDKAANRVTLTRFTYFATPQPVDDKTFSFSVQDITFACNDRKFQLGEAFITDAGGDVVGGGEPETTWRDIRAKTPEALLEGVMCRGDIIQNTQEFADLDAAMLGARDLALP